jgi:iron(III) transport system permease protein
MGWLVGRSDMPARRLVRLLVMASLVMPPFLGAVTWEILAAPNSGLLNQWGRALLGLADDAVLLDIYSLPGLVFVIACYSFPPVFVLVADALQRIPAELEDASSILGAGGAETVLRVTLPLALPALLAGALVAFLQAMTIFGSPAIIAMPAGFHTLTTKIWSFFQYPPHPGIASAAALPLLLVTIFLLRLQGWILGRRGYAVLGGRGGLPALVRLGAWRWPALLFCLLILACSALLPAFALLKGAFTRVVSQPLAPDNLTLHNFEFVLFGFSATQLALRNTFLLATAAATIGTLLALLAGYITARRAVRLHRLLGFLATAPAAIPGIVLGVGLFLAYTQPPFRLYGTLWILLIAYVTIAFPAAFQQLQSAFRSVHPELEEASRILGASHLQALFHITAPLLRAGIVSSWCFIFLEAMRELSAAIMLFTANTKVVATVMFDLNEGDQLGSVSVLGLILLASTVGVLGLAQRVSGGIALR